MVDIVNLWPDPKLQTTDGMTLLGQNEFENPTPTDSLAGFVSEGTATIALDPTSSIRGDGGVKVISPNSSSGIRISASPGVFVLPAYNDDINFTVYIRAREAMTITAVVDADYELWDLTQPYSAVGWGDLGWGEPYSYVPGLSYTFAANEVKRFRVLTRVKRVQSGGTWQYGTGLVGWKFHFHGTGTFDVDAVHQGYGVDDGVDPAGFPGGVYTIANAPLFFCGDTPDDDTYSYSWLGLPRASASLKHGHQLKYLHDDFGGTEEGSEPLYAITLPGGEKAGAHQSGWDHSSGSSADFTDGTLSGKDLKALGLDVGKSYVLSYDFVSMMENYIEGYIGGSWDQIYVEAGPNSYLGYPLDHPQRTRVNLPFTVTADPILAYEQVYRNWDTGYHAITSVSIFEVEFVMPQWSGAEFGSPEFGTPGTLDLLAQGVEPGKTYLANTDRQLDAGEYYRFEYQVSGGSWVTLSESLYDADYKSETYIWEFTVPEDATAFRFSLSKNGYASLDVFSKPPEFFYGDTPDEEGFIYSWAGAPGESASIMSEAIEASIEARIFISGIAVEVTDIRIVSGGILKAVTEIGH